MRSALTPKAAISPLPTPRESSGSHPLFAAQKVQPRRSFSGSARILHPHAGAALAAVLAAAAALPTAITPFGCSGHVRLWNLSDLTRLWEGGEASEEEAASAAFEDPETRQVVGREVPVVQGPVGKLLVCPPAEFGCLQARARADAA